MSQDDGRMIIYDEYLRIYTEALGGHLRYDQIPDSEGIAAVVNAVLEKAAQVFEKDDSQRWGYTADLAEIAKGIRELKVKPLSST